jgi:hypothetical protein
VKSKFRLIAYRDNAPSQVRAVRHYGDGFEAADRAMKEDPTLERVEIVQVVASISTPKAAQETMQL